MTVIPTDIPSTGVILPSAFGSPASTAVILAHNHPSGSPKQSQDDIRLTERLVKAGDLLGVPVLDHVIVAREGCTSIREQEPSLFAGVETLKKRKG